MSIVCAAMENGEVAIAADTQLSFGSLKINAPQLNNASKLFKVNDSVVGVVGWNAISSLFEYVAEIHGEIFDFTDRKQIFATLLKLHGLLKEEYFLETSENRSQPVESLQLDAMIINANGIYEISSYREVNQYGRYWAIGSGMRYALGAMEALYDTGISAKALVLNGVEAACKFDNSCSLPATSEVMEATSAQRIVMVN